MAQRMQRRNARNARSSWADVTVDAQCKDTAEAQGEALRRGGAKPGRGTDQKRLNRVPLMQDLIGNLPSPSRSGPASIARSGAASIARPSAASIARPSAASSHSGGTQKNSTPCSPPAYAPSLLAEPPVPPPPPSLPSSAYPTLQQQWEPSGPPEAAIGSYREKLRAGGRGALQRASDAGLGNNMMQEWGAAQMSAPLAPGILPQQGEVQNGMALRYASAGDSNQMWSGMGQMQSSEYWGTPTEAPQMPPQYPPMQAPLQQVAPQSHELSMAGWQVAPSMASVQQGQMPLQMQMAPQMLGQQQTGEQLPTMPQMQPQMQAQMPQAQTPVAASGDGASLDMSSIMAIMSGAPCDKDFMAAQLQAAADCQCYED